MDDDNGSLLFRLGLVTAGFESRLETAGTKMGLFKNKWDAAFQIVQGSAIIGFLDAMIERGGQIRDTADAFDISTDSLQALDFAAQQAGASTETLHNAYGVLKSKAADAATGNKQVAESLATLGINADEFVRASVDRQLEMVAKGAANAADQTEAYGAVVDLIGQKNAPRLNSVLKDLASEGLDGATESAKKFGQVLSEDAINRADALSDRLVILKNGLLNVGGAILNFGLAALENVGKTAAAVVNAVDGIQTDWDGGATAIKKAAVAAEQVNVAFKGTRATSEDIKKLEEAKLELSMAGQTAQQKLNALTEEYGKKIAEANQHAATSKEYIQAMTDALKIQKDIAEQTLKIDEQREKAAKGVHDVEIEYQKHLEETVTANLRYLTLQAKGVFNLTEQEKLEFQVLEMGFKIRQNNAEIEDALKKPVEERTQLEKEHLRTLLTQHDTLQTQLDAKNGIINATKDQAAAEKQVTAQVQATNNALMEGYKITVQTEYGKDETQLTDRELQEKITNLQNQLFDLNSQNDAINPGAAYLNDQLAAYINGQLGNALKEQNDRTNFRRDVTLYGEDRALGLRSAFDEDRYKSYINDTNLQKVATDTLQAIDDRLSTILKRA